MEQNAQIIEMQNRAVAQWAQDKPDMAARGITKAQYGALQNSIFPGASDESILMACDYCQARELDVMLKPVHLVPMKVKDAQSGREIWRDVVMPGVGLYRIQAARGGDYAGSDEPEFGNTVTSEFRYKDGNTVQVAHPEWCKYTVYKLVAGHRVAFIVKEYWIENYAALGGCTAPNSMWKKRPFAQLAKCAEAQALRRGWPEIGQEPTAEEMEGKHLDASVIEGEFKTVNQQQAQHKQIAYYPAADFTKNLPKWQQLIASGRKTAEAIINTVESKGALTDEQKQQLNVVQVEA